MMVTPNTQPWHPRGTPTWPDWKQADEGQRVRHVRSGREGTFVKVGNPRGCNKHAVVDWDPVPPFNGCRPIRGRVCSAAFDLEPIRNA